MTRLRTVIAAVGLVAVLTAAAADDRIPLAVTIDDLPITGGSHGTPEDRRAITRDLLAALERHGIRAVGLVTWNHIAGSEDLELLDAWLAAGHELGNHGRAHLDYSRTAPGDYVEDIEAARANLAEYLDARDATLRFFRFPMLHEGETASKLETMRTYLADSGQTTLPVTLDNADWSFARPWVDATRRGDIEAADHIARNFHESLHVSIRHHERTSRDLFGRPVPQILLLHATAIVAAEADHLFDWLEQEGFRFAPVDEVLADPAYADPPEFIGRRGFGLWDRVIAVDAQSRADRGVRAALATQVEAWNRGDLEAFTSIYDEDAVFVTPSGVTRGRQQVLDRYRTRYPDGDAMGALTLEVLETLPMAGVETSMVGDSRPSRVHGMTVTAKWILRFAEGADPPDAEGYTMIVFRPNGDGWVIVRDASM